MAPHCDVTILAAATAAQIAPPSSKRVELIISSSVVVRVAPDDQASATTGITLTPVGYTTIRLTGELAKRQWSGHSTLGGPVTILEVLEG